MATSERSKANKVTDATVTDSDTTPAEAMTVVIRTADTIPAEAMTVVIRTADTIPAEVMTGGGWDEETLRNAKTLDDVIALIEQTHGAVLGADQELGDGFTLLTKDQKHLLAGRPLILMEWAFYQGDFGGNFCAVRAVTMNPDKSISRYIFNDGSHGICEQLARYTKRTGRFGGLRVNNGLRVSEYDYEDKETGEKRPAKTYYLDVSA